jgi:hypothetical protein
MMAKIALSPTESVYLLAMDISAEEEKRFGNVVADVWSSWVPEKGRKAIHTHYSDIPMGTCPTIAIRPPMPGQWYMAQAYADGMMFLVNSMVAFNLPGGDAWLKLIIVHELGHCFLFATKHPSHGELRTHREMEIAADKVLEEWKIDTSDYKSVVEWFKNDAEARGVPGASDPFRPTGPGDPLEPEPRPGPRP